MLKVNDNVESGGKSSENAGNSQDLRKIALARRVAEDSTFVRRGSGNDASVCFA